jgi:hypothetical protein
MDARTRPDAIDTRFVFRLYAWMAIAGGCLMYRWPPTFMEAWVPGHLLPLVASTTAAFGCCAAGFAAIGDSIRRQPGRFRWGLAHMLFAAMFVIQWFAMVVLFVAPVVGWAELTVGLSLFYFAGTNPLGGVFGFGRPTPLPVAAPVRLQRTPAGSEDPALQRV